MTGQRLSGSGRPGHVNPAAALSLFGVLVVLTLFQFIFLPTESAAGALVALVLSLVVVVRASRDEDGSAVVLAWALRLLAGSVVFRLMAGVAGGIPDWFAYDREGWYLAEAIRAGQALPAFTLGGGADNVNAFVGSVYALVGRSTSSVAVLEALFGLLASWVYLGACRMVAPRAPAAIRYGILFFPSFVFWTSLVGKDPFVNLGLAFGVYGAVALCAGRGRVLTNVVLMAAGVLLCLLFRPHLVLVLVPALLAGLSFSLLAPPKGVAGARPGGGRHGRRLVVVAALIVGIGLGPALARTGAGRRLWVDEGGVDAWVTRAGEIREIGAQGGGSTTGFSGYGSLPAYFRALPVSLLTLFFRPFPWEVHNVAAAVAAVDTLLLSGVCVWLVVRAVTRRRRGRSPEPALGFLLVWLAAWALMFVNMTGNLGTMVRQRAQITPVILLLAGLAGRKARQEGGALRV